MASPHQANRSARRSHPQEGSRTAASSGGPRLGTRANTTDGGEELAERDVEPRRDGRRTHVVDRAADYVSLANQGLTVARIARRRRKSTAYVSILLRLGRALEGMEPGERAALRSPRITWSLAQRIVREGTDVVSLRAQLRHALGGFSTHNVDRRKHRAGRTRTVPPVVGVAWGWDQTWFDRDPIGYAAAHLEHLSSVHRAVHDRAGRAAASRTARQLTAGQSLRALQRAAVAATLAPIPRSPAESRALEAFGILDRKLVEARAEIEALSVAAGTRGGPPSSAMPLDRAPAMRFAQHHPPTTGSSRLSDEDIDTDLGD